MGDKWGQSEEENVSVWVNAPGGSQKLTLLWLSFSDGSRKECWERFLSGSEKTCNDNLLLSLTEKNNNGQQQVWLKGLEGSKTSSIGLWDKQVTNKLEIINKKIIFFALVFKTSITNLP